jgi:hypothetical protein
MKGKQSSPVSIPFSDEGKMGTQLICICDFQSTRDRIPCTCERIETIKQPTDKNGENGKEVSQVTD